MVLAIVAVHGLRDPCSVMIIGMMNDDQEHDEGGKEGRGADKAKAFIVKARVGAMMIFSSATHARLRLTVLVNFFHVYTV